MSNLADHISTGMIKNTPSRLLKSLSYVCNGNDPRPHNKESSPSHLSLRLGLGGLLQHSTDLSNAQRLVPHVKNVFLVL